MIPAPLLPLPAFNTVPLRAGAQLFRFHDPVFDGASYNPCKGGLTRFGPLALASGDCLPTLYAATTLEAAAWESLFHDVSPVAGPKSVRLSKVTSKVLSVIELGRDVVVTPLHAPDLNRLGLQKADLIETMPAEYAQTARWAEAFHRADSTVGGLRWTSRRCDPELAFVFFEDRVPQADWTVIERIDVAQAPDLLDEIRTIARRAEITLTI